jgi:hypothetical protein
MTAQSNQAIAGLFERRSGERIKISLPAQLDTLEFSLPVLMVDLGPYGARIVLVKKPSFTHASLRWLTYEATGELIWSNDKFCGLRFNRALSVAKLKKTENAPPPGELDRDQTILRWLRDNSA